MDAHKRSHKNQPKKQDRLKAYNEPSKVVMEATAESQRRVNERQRQHKELMEEEGTVDVDKEQYEILIGQLKAAEARNRLRIMRMRYESILEREVNHLISCQPTALRAVRLEAILPTRSKANQTAGHQQGSASSHGAPAAAPAHTDRMTKLDRSRVERLLSG